MDINLPLMDVILPSMGCSCHLVGRCRPREDSFTCKDARFTSTAGRSTSTKGELIPTSGRRPQRIPGALPWGLDVDGDGLVIGVAAGSPAHRCGATVYSWGNCEVGRRAVKSRTICLFHSSREQNSSVLLAKQWFRVIPVPETAPDFRSDFRPEIRSERVCVQT